ncbi:hypothetical protein ABL78_0553 [Leptomonas seymouri]|uniref:Uncharacterized protein n=1 Tax=Leptomonas seymouri TaxID=5684 RepID=A0A0N0P8T2_LEPSE|nr:hypothetical protein ABL78_0553 [Leptomonas seymouri]|eukprot:KPI90326.1 hypothetical protein ABL78_0553 [Leptomonas seymouri]
MRRTRCSLVDFVLDAPSKQLRATARKVEHWRTRRLQESKANTNPYNKEQYINAFLLAQSAATAHHHAVEATPAAQAALTSNLSTLTASQELTKLAQELETRYISKASTAQSALARSDETPQELSLQTFKRKPASATTPIAFGAWRSADAGNTRLSEKIRSADVVWHCVIREARTPPELSPEVVQRALPHQSPPAVRRLLTFLQARSFRAATKPVNMERLQSEVTAALRALKYSRELQKNVALFVVFSLSCFREWCIASHFVLWLHAQWPSLAEFTADSPLSEAASVCLTDSSHFAALLFETVRWASPKNASLLPTLGEVEQFCGSFCGTRAESTTGGGAAGEGSHGGLLWAPVVAAPLLSVVGLRESVDGPLRGATEQVEGLVERYCCWRSMPESYYHRKKAKPLAYMPALAWGEYLRALHRCGASLADLQAAADRITDPSATRNAAQLTSSTHLWNAYLACSPGPHAVEVYESNAKHYHVQSTPATMAAIMTALLNENTAEMRAQARVLWGRLRKEQLAKRMTTGTCSTVIAYIRLLQAEGDATAVRDLMTSYEDLYECFGVPREWFEQQRQELEKEGRRGESITTGGLRVLRRASAAFPLLIPPAVQVALVHAARKPEARGAGTATGESEDVRAALERISSASPVACAPTLTAEDLAAMM